MNEKIINDEKFLNKAQLLKEFIRINMAHETDIRVIWDSSKAYIRELYIQQNMIQRRSREGEMGQIRNEIEENEKILAKHPKNVSSSQKIKLLQNQLSTLLNYEIENNIKWMKQRKMRTYWTLRDSTTGTDGTPV